MPWPPRPMARVSWRLGSAGVRFRREVAPARIRGIGNPRGVTGERARLRDQGPILREQRYSQDGGRAQRGIRSRSERPEEDLRGAASEREVSAGHGEPAVGVAAASAPAPGAWLKRGPPDTQDRRRAHRTPRYWTPSGHSSQAESLFKRH